MNTRDLTGFASGAFYVTLTCVALMWGAARADTASLPVDEPTTIGNAVAVCTGIGLDARQDPQWKSYGLKIETAGKDGQYLGDQIVTVNGKNAAVSVRCTGPWVLFNLPKGQYTVTTQIGDNGPSKNATVIIGARQRQVMMYFPALGGAVTPVAGL